MSQLLSGNPVQLLVFLIEAGETALVEDALEPSGDDFLAKEAKGFVPGPELLGFIGPAAVGSVDAVPTVDAADLVIAVADGLGRTHAVVLVLDFGLVGTILQGLADHLLHGSVLGILLGEVNAAVAIFAVEDVVFIVVDGIVGLAHDGCLAFFSFVYA